MSSLTPSEMGFLDHVLMMESGYCLDFSDRSFAKFFAEIADIDIEEEHYYEGGSSKGKRMRHFLRTQPDDMVCRILRALWERRMDMQLRGHAVPDTTGVDARYGGIVERLSTSHGTPMDAIDRFSSDPTLEELIAGIQRDVAAGSPETALDRLHTYCMKKFAHLLESRNPNVALAGTLNARAGQYLSEARRGAKTHHPVSFKIMTSAVETFELFNDVRNNHSLAHDNKLIERAEARFIFDAIVNLLRFIKSTEGQAFGV